MKKIIIAFSIFLFAIITNMFAQTGGMHVAGGEFNFTAGKMKEGINTLTKEGQGTLTFEKKGDSFSEVIFKDAGASTTRLISTSAGTGGAPMLTNKSKLPDTCFGTANKSFGLCVTKSGNIYTVTFIRAGVYRWVATYQ